MLPRVSSVLHRELETTEELSDQFANFLAFAEEASPSHVDSTRNKHEAYEILHRFFNRAGLLWRADKPNSTRDESDRNDEQKYSSGHRYLGVK